MNNLTDETVLSYPSLTRGGVGRVSEWKDLPDEPGLWGKFERVPVQERRRNHIPYRIPSRPTSLGVLDREGERGRRARSIP